MSHSQAQYSVNKLYQSVIDDVISGTREAFLDEGVDEQVQQELRMLWESKLVATRAIDSTDSQGPSTANGKAKGGGHSSSNNSHAQSSNSNSNSVPPLPAATAPHHPQPLPMVSADPQALVPIQITMPRGPADSSGFQRTITIHVPAACIHSNKLQDILSLPAIQGTLSLPSELAAASLQGQVNQALLNAGFSLGRPIQPNRLPTIMTNAIPQIDGGGDTSSDDDDDDDDENEDDDNDDKDDEEEEQQEEEETQDEEPLNSGDDVSDNDDPTEKLYDIENVVVCQYDKITRTRNKWKFHLKDGIMNLNGKDYVFQKANGDAEW
ncbi:transcription initiation factor IIA subunit 1 [Folsomia candida]|uniref:Transcription initiation factor IIA subunit 1 n=1 Tax=Folsomia candida TaxID=158441 RepID=A0A226ER04_FOLCA|nr:transcription initiation factor IIA subunit 1 [Folsomia candida]OXA60063.1 Transcription initiation factor IIA subunit 1 [Folsomia candida]